MRHLPLLLGLLILAGCNTYGYDTGRRANSRGYDRADRAARSYPSWARVNDRGRTAYLMCHKGNKTKAYRTNAVRGHLRHGDSFGSCNDRRNRRARQGDRRNRRNRRGYRQGRRDERGGRRYEDRRRHDDDDDDHDDDDDD